MKDCNWYLQGCCCKDLDAGRVWDCTAPNKKERHNMFFKKCEGNIFKISGICPYPKLSK